MKTTKTQTKPYWLGWCKLLALLAVFQICSPQAEAQVTIGSNYTPVKGALLDLKQTDAEGLNSTLGLGVSRVYLEEEDALYPMFDKATSSATDYVDDKGNAIARATADQRHVGLLVYNVSDEDPFCPGLYVWTGEKWMRLPEDCEGNTPSTNLIFYPNYNVDAGLDESDPLYKYVNTLGSFIQGTTDDCTRGAGVAHSAMPAGVFRYTGAEGEAFAGYTYDHASGITVTIDAATLATGAGELPVKVSGTVDAAYAGKAFDIPITVLGQQLYVRVNVGCGAYTTAMANRTIVKGSPQLTGDPDWLQFQCFNLGADATKDPFQRIVGDEKGENGTLGWLFQWGRNADGHQLRNSETTYEQSDNINPGHNKYIEVIAADWIDDDVADKLRWGDDSEGKDQLRGPTDPCPAGWKVPSHLQLLSILYYNTNYLNSTADIGGLKIGNGLFLPRPGRRSDLSGWGNYWSSTGYVGSAESLTLSVGSWYPNQSGMAGSASVRCVIDTDNPCNSTTPIQSAKVESCLPYMFTYQTMTLTATGYDAEDNVVPMALYQWYVNDVKIDGATGETFKLTPDIISTLTLEDDGLGNNVAEVPVYCKVSNSEGTKNSNIYKITIVEATKGVLSPIHVNSVDENGNSLGKITIAHVNLGAETDTDPCSMWGDLYQWGRPKDEHQLRANNEFTDEISDKNVPGHPKFITASSSPYNWRSGYEDALWGNGSATDIDQNKADNDPCPDGWKVPSHLQWWSIYGTGTISNTTSYFFRDASTNDWAWIGDPSKADRYGVFPGGVNIAKALYLPAGFKRSHYDGEILENYVGISGYYWSASVIPSIYSYAMNFAQDGIMILRSNRAYGYSVRCVKCADGETCN
ncbi:hypothetical protein D0T84_21085 [Dysgonomonas sp. 521]|uniref:FISUMP domain-containing protein n=1 Tax=Dysgonomonas sp. 521 TaxID=2302932 RepID=UPI0013D02C9B|nr:FISUMP domain-containing protein [Dysgonomonas sp. 521]NDV97372.1 hypothetical protein [Dysgonomonas sp. 521]